MSMHEHSVQFSGITGQKPYDFVGIDWAKGHDHSVMGIWPSTTGDGFHRETIMPEQPWRVQRNDVITGGWGAPVQPVQPPGQVQGANPVLEHLLELLGSGILGAGEAARQAQRAAPAVPAPEPEPRAPSSPPAPAPRIEKPSRVIEV
jgi:hypothetical protein